MDPNSSGSYHFPGRGYRCQSSAVTESALYNMLNEALLVCSEGGKIPTLDELNEYAKNKFNVDLMENLDSLKLILGSQDLESTYELVKRNANSKLAPGKYMDQETSSTENRGPNQNNGDKGSKATKKKKRKKKKRENSHM